jgi:hypothetical protein
MIILEMLVGTKNSEQLLKENDTSKNSTAK